MISLVVVVPVKRRTTAPSSSVILLVVVGAFFNVLQVVSSIVLSSTIRTTTNHGRINKNRNQRHNKNMAMLLPSLGSSSLSLSSLSLRMSLSCGFRNHHRRYHHPYHYRPASAASLLLQPPVKHSSRSLTSYLNLHIFQQQQQQSILCTRHNQQRGHHHHQQQQQQQQQAYYPYNIRPKVVSTCGGWGRPRQGRTISTTTTRRTATAGPSVAGTTTTMMMFNTRVVDDDGQVQQMDGGEKEYHVLKTDELVKYLQDVIDVILCQAGRRVGPNSPHQPQLLTPLLCGSKEGERTEESHQNENNQIIDDDDDDDDDGSTTTSRFTLRLNEKHRALMIRTIQGLSKSDFKEQLRRVLTQHQWKRTKEFWSEEGSTLWNVVSSNDAPQFHTTLQKYLTTLSINIQLEDDDVTTMTEMDVDNCNNRNDQPTMKDYQYPNLPSKFFSMLARGRKNQGRFDRLLEDVRPGLLGRYREEIVSDMPESELLRLFVEDVVATIQSGSNDDGDDDDDRVELLRLCMAMPVVPPPKQAADGGKSAGARGEFNLSSYLTLVVKNSIENDGDTDGNQTRRGNNLRILSPVLVQPTRRSSGRRKSWHTSNNSGNNPSSTSNNNRTVRTKGPQYVLEIPAEAMVQGLTHEFDAMVVEQIETPSGDDVNREGTTHPSSSMVIHQVWDAKATADTFAIYDVLTKKMNSLRRILRQNHHQPSSVHFVILDDLRDVNNYESVQIFDVANSMRCDDEYDDDEDDDNDDTNNPPGADSTNIGEPDDEGDMPTSNNNRRFPLIGIFANKLPSSRNSARSVQVATCEMLLGTDIDVVRNVLQNGNGVMDAQTDAAVDSLMRLIRNVQNTQPVLVVAGPSKESIMKDVIKGGVQ